MFLRSNAIASFTAGVVVVVVQALHQFSVVSVNVVFHTKVGFLYINEISHNGLKSLSLDN